LFDFATNGKFTFATKQILQRNITLTYAFASSLSKCTKNNKY